MQAARVSRLVARLYGREGSSIGNGEAGALARRQAQELPDLPPIHAEPGTRDHFEGVACRVQEVHECLGSRRELTELDARDGRVWHPRGCRQSTLGQTGAPARIFQDASWVHARDCTHVIAEGLPDSG